MSDIARELARVALEIKAIKLSPHAPFTWASGYRMPIYNDNRLLLSRPEYRALVASGFEAMAAAHGVAIDVVAGTSTAGIPHATTFADRIKKPLIYVRSAAKDHGLQNRIEGKLESGARALLIEDLISVGGSSVDALLAVRQAGAQINTCFAIFSYALDEATRKFNEADAQAFPLLTFDTLLREAIDQRYISEAEEKLLAAWREDPFSWGEKHGFPKIERS